MSKNININNKYRVLLTEVLPYEIPLMLDNEGFYFNMQDKNLYEIFKEAFGGDCKNWTIPFDYSVRKYSGDKSRKLSLMHPLIQLKCVDFYEKYNFYMISLCSNSPFSIRHIENCAKCIFKTEDENKTNLERLKHVEILDGEIEKYYRSYFSYKQYDIMYKFFISGDYLRLEQKYTHLMKMDIANCFYHIYTHTITWAVKGKELAKDSIGKITFENEFDKLMRYANYNETNGIIVGPEISRIFAEVIFQRIDVNVINRLRQEPISLQLGRDYEVRRYVDDHYVYANSEDNLRKILEIYKEELQYYKLFVNENKLEFWERPFVSDISAAKREISKLMSDVLEKYLKKNDENDLYIKNNEMKLFSAIVNDFRSLTYKYKQKYGTLNRYFLTLIVSQIGNELDQEHIPNASIGLLLMYAEVAFYIFSLDMNVSASIKLCRILEYLHSWAKKCSDKTILPELENKIYREFKRCLDIYETTYKSNDTNIEVLNIMLCLSRLMNTPIQRSLLVKLFMISDGKLEEYNRLNYFQICTLLYIIGRDVNCEDIRLKLVKEIEKRLLVDNALRHADNAMLFFDAIICPYIEKKEVKNIIIKHYNCNEKTYGRKYKELIRTKRWFFNWNKMNSLSELISKKEYHSPYE